MMPVTCIQAFTCRPGAHVPSTGTCLGDTAAVASTSAAPGHAGACRYFMVGGSDPANLGSRFAPGASVAGVQWPGGSLGPPFDPSLSDATGLGGIGNGRGQGLDSAASAQQGSSQVSCRVAYLT